MVSVLTQMPPHLLWKWFFLSCYMMAHKRQYIEQTHWGKTWIFENAFFKSRGKDNLSFCLVFISEQSVVYNSIKIVYAFLKEDSIKNIFWISKLKPNCWRGNLSSRTSYLLEISQLLQILANNEPNNSYDKKYTFSFFLMHCFLVNSLKMKQIQIKQARKQLILQMSKWMMLSLWTILHSK